MIVPVAESEMDPAIDARTFSSMRILVVTQYFWPESFRITEVVQTLLGLECDVTVLTGQPNYPEGKTFAGYRATGCGVQRHPSEGFDIYRVPQVPRGGGSGLRLALNYVSFILSACTFGLWLLRGKKVDVVFVYAPSPILQVIAGIVVAKVKGCAVVTWVQDLWPESLAVTGFVQNRHLLGMVRRVVRWIYQHNDLLLVQSRSFVEPVQSLAGGTHVIYYPNPGELAFDRSPVTLSPLALDGGFNVVFAGNLGTVQALDTVLDAAEMLLDVPRLKIVLVGSGSRSAWLESQIADRGLHNVRLAGRFPPDVMPSILAQASALLVSLARNSTLSQTVPAKIQAYLAAAKPVIASLDGEGAAIVREAKAGITCPAEDSLALADAIRTMSALSPTVLGQYGVAARSYYERHFHPKVLAKTLAGCFWELMRRDQRETSRSISRTDR